MKLDEYQHLYEVLSGQNDDYSNLQDQVQALAIIRQFKINGTILAASESNTLATLVTKLLSAKVKNLDPETLARECHTIIQEWLTKQFFELPLDRPINAMPLVPFCMSPKIQVEDLYHCEARFAADRDENRKVIKRHEPTQADCPRIKQMLCHKVKNGYAHGYAHFEPDLSLSWENWSLLELFQVAGVDDRMLESAFATGRGEGDEAVNRLAGEINRLNEIRPRLSCRLCSARLQFSNKFSVKDAVYRSTVTLPCTTPNCGGGSVYLSHCRSCPGLIDSRDSRFKDSSGYYVCIACASGEDVEKAGEICPKCGERNQLRGNRRKKVCQREGCGHQVELPSRARRAKLSPTDEVKFYTDANRF